MRAAKKQIAQFAERFFAGCLGIDAPVWQAGFASHSGQLAPPLLYPGTHDDAARMPRHNHVEPDELENNERENSSRGGARNERSGNPTGCLRLENINAGAIRMPPDLTAAVITADMSSACGVDCAKARTSARMCSMIPAALARQCRRIESASPCVPSCSPAEFGNSKKPSVTRMSVSPGLNVSVRATESRLQRKPNGG